LLDLDRDSSRLKADRLPGFCQKADFVPAERRRLADSQRNRRRRSSCQSFQMVR
jgi:hypothetical protein